MMEDSRISDLKGMPSRIIERMLTGSMDCLLPMSLVEEDDHLYAVYSLVGYWEISGKKFGAVSILEITERVIKMLEELKDNLIWPEDVILNKEIIFLDPGTRETRLCLIPEPSEVGGKENVSYLLEELKELTDEEGKAYLDYFIKEYKSRSLRPAVLLGILEDLKREAGQNHS